MIIDDHPLFKAASALPTPLFAVTDGGQFDDPNFVLQTANLSGMSLYLEGGDSGSRAAAGWLVTLREERDLRAVIDVAACKNALVLWSWPHGQMTLYRHLRTLNLVEIPNENRENDEDPAYETVLFRHWDPNVLGTLLPLLDAAQRARFLGAATGIAFDAGEFAGVCALPRPASLPPPSPGMMRFSGKQMKDLARQQQGAMAHRVAAYLLETVPNAARYMPDGDLFVFSNRCVTESTALGMQSEGAHCRWAYLQLNAQGRMLHSPGVSDLFQKPDVFVSADDRVAMLMQGIIRHMTALR